MAEPAFKLKFAPHFGMFKHSGGEDLIDQLKFMADQGFRAFEDNGMKNREIAVQERIAQTLSDLNMEMGVFVGGRIQNRSSDQKINDPAIKKAFLEDIRSSGARNGYRCGWYHPKSGSRG